MKTKLLASNCAAEAMAGSLPKLFVSVVGILLFSGVFSAFLLGHEVFAKTFGMQPGSLDESALQLILHRNAASTVLPQTLHFVHDKF